MEIHNQPSAGQKEMKQSSTFITKHIDHAEGQSSYLWDLSLHG